MQICAPNGHFWNLKYFLVFLEAECDISYWDFWLWRLLHFKIILNPSRSISWPSYLFESIGSQNCWSKKASLLVSKKSQYQSKWKFWYYHLVLPPPTLKKSKSLTLSASFFFFAVENLVCPSVFFDTVSQCQQPSPVTEDSTPKH